MLKIRLYLLSSVANKGIFIIEERESLDRESLMKNGCITYYTYKRINDKDWLILSWSVEFVLLIYLFWVDSNYYDFCWCYCCCWCDRICSGFSFYVSYALSIFTSNRNEHIFELFRWQSHPLNDHIFGIPILGYLMDKLDESSTNERCNESGMHAANKRRKYIEFTNKAKVWQIWGKYIHYKHPKRRYIHHL